MYCEIDYDMLIKTFDKNFISDLSKIYKSIGFYPNKIYFNNPGTYNNRFVGLIPDHVSEHFEHLLFPPNYAILDFALKNDKKLIYTDCGAGVGNYFGNVVLLESVKKYYEFKIYTFRF